MKNLQAIIDRVKIRHEEMGDEFNINQLRSILRDVETPIDEFELPELAPEGIPYSRRILYRDEQFEVSIIRWKAAAETAIHDYGDSYGIIRVLSGNLNFQVYDNYLRELAVGNVPAVDAFDLPKGIIHKIYNPSVYDEAVSLNFYCPNVDSLSLYDEEKREKLQVSKDVRAWIPSEKDIISREKLPDIPEDTGSE
ncbi:MAG: hypothetical protein GX879_10570 [Bacteroidales bacterium]|nr:hypothetical protein [Bacteroidales bacterium]